MKPSSTEPGPVVGSRLRWLAWLAMLLGVSLLALLLGSVVRTALRMPKPEEGGPPPEPTQELVIISPHCEGIRYEFGHGFERWYEEQTGQPVTVDWRDFGGTSDDVKYIRSGFTKSPEGIGIDLFFGGGIPPYELLAEEGLFEPYQLPDDILQHIPAQYPGGDLYDPQFRYYGTVLSGFGILYNKEVLRRLNLPEPESWEDLAAPEAFTWVGMGDPRSSGSALMVFEIILQAYGWVGTADTSPAVPAPSPRTSLWARSPTEEPSTSTPAPPSPVTAPTGSASSCPRARPWSTPTPLPSSKAHPTRTWLRPSSAS